MRCFAVVCVAITFVLACNATRTDISAIYQPTYTRLKSLADTSYTRTTKEYTTLNSQVTSTKARLITNVQTRINLLREEIVNATKTANIAATTLACVKKQQTAAAGLSTSFLTNACSIATNNSALTTSKARLTTLSNVAIYAITWCGSLNPLETQDDPFDSCLANKITDLYRQINIVESEFNALSIGTLNGFTQCISDISTKYLSTLPQIRYNLNMCFIVV